jgi:hypothetical protein
LNITELTNDSDNNSKQQYSKKFKNLQNFLANSKSQANENKKSSSIEDLVPKEVKEEMYNQRYEILKEKLSKIQVDDLINQIQPEDLIDPFCDPDNPVKITFNDVSAAAYRIKGGVENTPCTVSYHF